MSSLDRFLASRARRLLAASAGAGLHIVTDHPNRHAVGRSISAPHTLLLSVAIPNSALDSPATASSDPFASQRPTLFSHQTAHAPDRASAAGRDPNPAATSVTGKRLRSSTILSATPNAPGRSSTPFTAPLPRQSDKETRPHRSLARSRTQHCAASPPPLRSRTTPPSSGRPRASLSRRISLAGEPPPSPPETAALTPRG